MSLATPEKIRKLQRALYVKAKQEPTRRFHFLYDKVWRADILAHAYACCRANGGAPGVDGETFRRIEAYGVERWLDELREEVRAERYKPQPVRRVMIPKASGVGQRPLGIPPIRDRVVQTAALLVLEPIFEADFDEAAYGYENSKDGLVVRAVIDGKKIRRASFVPVTRDTKNDVLMLDPASGEGAKLVEVIKGQSGDTPLWIDGQEVVLIAHPAPVRSSQARSGSRK